MNRASAKVARSIADEVKEQIRAIRSTDTERIEIMLRVGELLTGENRRSERLEIMGANSASDLQKTEALETDDACEFRYPARREWRKGHVLTNGGAGYWTVKDDETGRIVHGLYIEHVRAPGTDPWT